MTLFEALWKCDLVTLSKICLRFRPSAYLSINLRINRIISGIPRGISKIIFVQGFYKSLAMPNGKTRQGPFFYDSIFENNSVPWICQWNFWIPINFFHFRFNCSNILYLRNLQEQVIYLVQLIKYPILQIPNILFQYFLSIFSGFKVLD